MATIRLGLCCVNYGLRSANPPVFSSRGITLLGIKKLGMDELKNRAIQNLEDTITLLEWNEKHNIKVFRLSSDIFPHYTNIKHKISYTLDFAKPLLREIGKIAKKYNHRLTFHPSHHNILNSPRQEVLDGTIRDLEHHATMLDIMGLDSQSVMIIHGGGTYGDKPLAIDRWVMNYKKLPLYVRRRLVLENDERQFSIRDCLYINSKCKVPIVFDIFHHQCYVKLHPEEKLSDIEYYIPHILKTWKHNVRPKMHISSQGAGKIGHHADYIDNIPDCILEIPRRYGIGFDIYVEAKKKELAIFKLRKQYPMLNE